MAQTSNSLLSSTKLMVTRGNKEKQWCTLMFCNYQPSKMGITPQFQGAGNAPPCIATHPAMHLCAPICTPPTHLCIPPYPSVHLCTPLCIALYTSMYMLHTPAHPSAPFHASLHTSTHPSAHPHTPCHAHLQALLYAPLHTPPHPSVHPSTPLYIPLYLNLIG